MYFTWCDQVTNIAATMYCLSLFLEPNPEFDSYLQGPVPMAVTTTTLTVQTNSSPAVALSSAGEC
jgi:hypothetical protein